MRREFKALSARSAIETVEATTARVNEGVDRDPVTQTATVDFITV